MILLYRFLPLLVAVLEGVLFWSQMNNPLTYPWIVVFGIIALPAATVAIAWKRLPLSDAFERILPSFILLLALAFALLLVEGPLAVWAVIIIASVSVFISLELLFLLVYDPPRYPVNGISRANIAYVPIAVWYAASTSVGLLVFLHTPPIWHVALMTVLGAVLFRTTGHSGASLHEKAVWSLLGALVGVHIGLLGIMLPISMPMHGLIAAFLVSVTLRARRYLYAPHPSPRQAWIEGVAAVLLFVTSLSTAKWL
ncbi:MAG: hypothetical protein ABIO72_00925 [Patescibacteria group bacterium]